MKSFLHIIFAVFFHFLACAFVCATDVAEFKVEIAILQFIFIAYQVFVLIQKDKMK